MPGCWTGPSRHQCGFSAIETLQDQMENTDLHRLGISPLASVGQIAVSIAQMYYSPPAI